MRVAIHLIVFLVGSLGCLSLAEASACNVIVRREIKMRPGAQCWTYEGYGNTFIGNFRRGQRIVAKASPSSRARKEVRDLDVDLTASAGNKYLGDDFVTPVSGRYEFSIAPCVIWDDMVRVQICARNP